MARASHGTSSHPPKKCKKPACIHKPQLEQNSFSRLQKTVKIGANHLLGNILNLDADHVKEQPRKDNILIAKHQACSRRAEEKQFCSQTWANQFAKQTNSSPWAEKQVCGHYHNGGRCDFRKLLVARRQKGRRTAKDGLERRFSSSTWWAARQKCLLGLWQGGSS